VDQTKPFSLDQPWKGTLCKANVTEMVPSCGGAERELLLDSLGEEHGVGFGERAETQRHGEVKPKNKTFRMLKNAPREDGKK